MDGDEKRHRRFMVVCRDVANYEQCRTHVPDGFEVRECEVCHRRVAVSATGIEQSKAGGIVVCNSCGLALARRLQEAGKAVELRHNRPARDQLGQILARLIAEGG